MDSRQPIYTPPPERIERSQMTAFARFCSERSGRPLHSYQQLHAFSVREPASFWALLLEFSRLRWAGSATPALLGRTCEKATFFPGLELNYADNLLAGPPGTSDDAPALTACDERGGRVRLHRGALRERVLRTAAGLVELGVRPGQRIIAVAGSTADTAVACLATTAIGATWSAVSPELGVAAMRSRFAQLEPTVLFYHARHQHHGQTLALDDRLGELARSLPTLRATVALDQRPLALGALPALGLDRLSGCAPLPELPRFPFNHPLFILFSSGTTGAPKCIVHGTGGTLLEHYKELRLHHDLGPEDRLYFHTATGWMMWNWQLSALLCGTEIVLHDGSATYPAPDALWQRAAAERITVLGTSPAYLALCQSSELEPGTACDLGALRALLSTGSVLPASLYTWVHDQVRADLPVQSICGGTDILGCFFSGHPGLPVYPGEAQCIGLGMDVCAVGEDGDELPPGEAGELVCRSPFPSRPVGLLGDPDGERLHEAYFAVNPGAWTHGDTIALSTTGGVRILGRSDGVMNIHGVRIGPAEIYGALEEIAEIGEAMAVARSTPELEGGSELWLLVVLRPGVSLDRPLALRIKKHLATACSRAHVPQQIVQMHDLPTTHSGKRSERAARDVLNGVPPGNRDALRNPGCLDELAEWLARLEPARAG
jgi:acetoacetyl-CoA synthetase